MLASHSFEPELLKPPPRPVRRRGSGRRLRVPGCVGCFILPHTIVGIGLAGWFLWTVLLVLAGQTVAGSVTGRNTDKDSDGNTTYHLNYRYTHQDDVFENRASVTPSTYRAFPPGAAVTVKVFPLFAGLAPRLEVPGNRGAMHPLVLLCIAVFWNGIVAVFWWQVLGRPLQHRRLVSRGIPVVGRVIYKRVVTGSYGDSHYVRYEYFPPGAGLFGPMPQWPDEEAAVAEIAATVQEKGIAAWREVVQQAKAKAKRDEARRKAPASPGALTREDAVDATDYAAVQPGDWITVLHDAVNPRRAVAYRFAGYEAL